MDLSETVMPLPKFLVYPILALNQLNANVMAISKLKSLTKGIE